MGLTDQQHDLLSFASFQDQAAKDLHAGHQQYGCRDTQNAYQLQLLKDEGLYGSFRKPRHRLVCMLSLEGLLSDTMLELG